MASQRSLYDVLNVSPDAETVVIEAAYRALMKKYHPDQAAAAGGETSSSAAEINRAFAILRDSTRRADYDHREWTRRQAFHLAESQTAQTPRPRSAFGWGGWFVALLLGIVLVVLINGRGGVVVPGPGSNEATPAASAEPDHRSQPTKIEPAFLASTGPSELDREIVQREAASAAAALLARTAEPELGAEAEPVAAAELAEASPPAPRRRTTTAPRPRVKSPRRGAARPAEAEEDFLQREGYIY